MNASRARLLALALAAGAAVALPAAAKDYKLDTLDIGGPWARASAGNAKSGAAYLSLRNGGTGADRLVSAATPAAERTELHTHRQEGDVMRMVEVPAIDVPPGAEVKLQPGGLHVMFFGLKAPLRAGETFPLTLTFEKAGTITVDVGVQEITSGGAMPQRGGHGHTRH